MFGEKHINLYRHLFPRESAEHNIEATASRIEQKSIRKAFSNKTLHIFSPNHGYV
jgi:hypothetical protein